MTRTAEAAGTAVDKPGKKAKEASAARAATRLGGTGTGASAKPAAQPPKTTATPKTAASKRRNAAAWPRFRRPLRLRLLPLTIFAAVLMLGVRVGDLWLAVTGHGDIEIHPVGQTLAQSAQPDKANAPPAKALPAASPQPAPATAAAPAKPAESVPPTRQPPLPSMSGTRIDTSVLEGEEPKGPDLSGVRAEILQRLNERREELDRRARELDQREALMVAAEKSIEQKIAELGQLRGNIEKLLRQVDERQAAQLDSLVKIYETMKPKEAARIFEELDMPVLLNVLERMKESKSAPILAAMDPLKAKNITAELVDRRALPGTAQR